MRPNNNRDSKPARVKPITKTLPFVVTGQDQWGNEYDAESAKAIVAELQTNGTFVKLAVMATIAKKVLFNKEDARGVADVARIQSYNVETGEVDLLFFGRNTEHAAKMDDMVVVPRVRCGYKTTEVASIMSFEIVPQMEA